MPTLVINIIDLHSGLQPVWELQNQWKAKYCVVKHLRTKQNKFDVDISPDVY